MFKARLLCFFLLIVPVMLQAQSVSVGVYIDKQAHLDEIPVSFYVIDGIQDMQVLSSIKKAEKPIWVASGLSFTRSFDLLKNPDSLSNALRDPVIYYRRAGITIDTYIVGTHIQASSDLIAFLEASLDDISMLSGARSALLTTVENASDFSALTATGIVSISQNTDLALTKAYSYVFLLPEFVEEEPAAKLRIALDHALTTGQGVIIPWSLLEHMSDSDPLIWPLIQEYMTAETPVFALNRSSTIQTATSGTIGILLLGCWLLLGLFFFANGAYHRSVSRYFFTHNFFINDVMSRRLKPESEILIGFLITSLFGGLFAICLFEQIDSWLVRELLDVHGFWLFDYLQNDAVVFAFGALSMITGISVIILWLSAASSGRVSLSQATQITIYPMHIIVLLATLLAVLQLNGVSGKLPLVIGLAGFFGMLMCMPVCSIDVKGFLMQQQMRFTLVGPVLYTTVVLSALVWILFFTPTIDTFMLLVQLLP